MLYIINTRLLFYLVDCESSITSVVLLHTKYDQQVLLIFLRQLYISYCLQFHFTNIKINFMDFCYVVRIKSVIFASKEASIIAMPTVPVLNLVNTMSDDGFPRCRVTILQSSHCIAKVNILSVLNLLVIDDLQYFSLFLLDYIRWYQNDGHVVHKSRCITILHPSLSLYRSHK